MPKTIIYLSDGTGITAETVGHSLLTQFKDVSIRSVTIPYVDSVDKAKLALDKINTIYEQDQSIPIIIATLVNNEVNEIINQSKGKMFELYDILLDPFAKSLDGQLSHTIGKSHGIHDSKIHQARIDAINFTMQTDDGVNIENYKNADIILTGPSRSGKTPTCLYLAMQFGVSAANYPLVNEDLQKIDLPKALTKYKHKIFGLQIEPDRLQTIRHERQGTSRYSSMTQCIWEINKITKLYKQYSIPYLNTTTFSIEEIATKILAIMGLKKKMIHI